MHANTTMNQQEININIKRNKQEYRNRSAII